MRVCVFEQWMGGHYFTYLQHLLPALAEVADEVVVALTRPAYESERFEQHLGFARNDSRIRFDPSVPERRAAPTAEPMALLANLRDAVERARPDYVIVPSADGPNLALGLLGQVGLGRVSRVPCEGTFHYGYGPAATTPKQRLKDFAYRLTYRGSSLAKLNFVNPLVVEAGRARGESWARRAQVMPDPLALTKRVDARQARRLLGVPEDGRYLGLLGSLDARKAIPELLAAFRAATLADSDRLLLAGKLDAGFAALIASEYADLIASGRLLVLDRYLSDEELLQGYSALDVACVTYRNFHGLASLALKALGAGRPIVTHDRGWTRAIVKRFGVGHACDVGDIALLARVLRTALDQSATYVESDAAVRLLEYHSTENFASSMVQHAARHADRTARPVKTWDWVLDAVDPQLKYAY